MIEASLILLAAIARVIVGMGLASRWLVYPPVALACAYYAFGPTIWTPIFAALAAYNVGAGWTKWENRPYQAIRYSLLPLAAVIAYHAAGNDAPAMFAWPAACALVGWLDWTIRTRLEPYGFAIFGREITSAQYAEFVIGAVLIGGVTLL